MFVKGDRVIYSREGHACYGFIGTIQGINSQQNDHRWYAVEWDTHYPRVLGYYEGNLSLYNTTPDWEV